MCFSAGASLTAGGGLSLMGGASLKYAKKEERVLALFPIAFGIQQILEGVQWLYIHNGSPSLLIGYLYLFFAYAFWPAFVPIAVYLYDKKKRHTHRWVVCLGIGLSLYMLFYILTGSLHISAETMHINYSLNIPHHNIIIGLYLACVFAPFFNSSSRFLKWFGFINVCLAIFAGVIYTSTFASVWCFFAAISSGLFLYKLRSKNRLA